MALNRKQPNADHAQIAFDLAAQPHVWGTVRVYPTAYVATDTARHIEAASGKFPMYGPAGYFETRTTPVEDGTLLEARYVGGISKPRQRPASTPSNADMVWADALTVLSPPTGLNGAS